MTNEPQPPATPEGTDPSMEEILASIRRILNDDEVPAEPPEAVVASDDVLILDESMVVAAAEPDPVPHQRSEPLALPPPPEEPRHQEQETVAAIPAPPAEPKEPPLLSPDLLAPEAAAAAALSVGSLVRTLAAGRSTQVYAGGPTLEDMVRAELRPLLKGWLDEHLPPMVERLVRAEIERVVAREVP